MPPEIDLAAKLAEMGGTIMEADEPNVTPAAGEQLPDEDLTDGQPQGDEPGAQPDGEDTASGQEEPDEERVTDLPPEMLGALIEIDGEKMTVAEMQKRQREMRKRFTQGLQEFADANKALADERAKNARYSAMDKAVEDNPRLGEALDLFFKGEFEKAQQVYTDANYSPKPATDPRVDELMAERAQERQTVWAASMNERLNALTKDNPAMDRDRVIGLMGSETVLQTDPRTGQLIPMLTPEAAYKLAYHDELVKAAKKAGYDEYKAAAAKGGAAKATPAGAALGKLLPRKPKNAEEAIQMLRESGAVTDDMLFD